MRQPCLYGLFLALVATVWLSGCSKQPRPELGLVTDGQDIAPAEPQPAQVPPAGDGPPAEFNVDSGTPQQPDTGGAEFELPAVSAKPTAQEKYDAALLAALNLLADRKYAEALASLEAARAVQDTEQVRLEIDKVKGLIEQQAAAEQTAKSIQTVLTDGKPEEASQLATASLQQFGGSDEADRLAKLKREADALTSASGEDDTARLVHFRQEGEAALAEKNLRAAAIAFEQAVQYGEDASVRKQLDDLHASLARYDDGRRRAHELRRDPANLEAAITALRDAAAAWDTLQVREEIDTYTLALQKRRDRISVADFEVRGDVGIPSAGRAVAEEILPAFKGRFDLVERGQVQKVIDELRLEATDLAENESGRREVGRLARVRYLVVGSVSQLSGITVNARLVDVQTGLVVQTAKLVAPTPDQLLARLPQLASVLLLTDEQKIAYEQQCAQRAAAVQAVVVGTLPPPPELPVAGQPVPPPVIVYSPRPPDFGGLQPDDFERLPGPGQVTAALSFSVEQEAPFKHRVLQIAVELGDNLFRRGRYREAHAQFELAFSLSPERQDLRVRVERCRPLLPPPPPVVAVPVPPPVVVAAPVPRPPVVVVARPRIAVLSFAVNASPGLVPDGFGDWAADHLASYYAPTYEVVDRGVLFWYMGRLGLTVRAVATDPCASRYLARALGVRYFAFGVVQQTASFDVTAHLLDAETGARQGTGNIHVQDHPELKLRMNELVRQTLTNPTEQARLQREGKEGERQLNEARQLLKAGQPAQAAEACRAALRQHPDSVALQTLLQQAEQQTRQAALEAARQQDAQRRQALAAAAQRRQEELAREAEAARRRAAQATQSAAAKQALAQQRERGHQQLVAQGRHALQQGDYRQAVQTLESAVALKPTEETKHELAEAKAAARQAFLVKSATDKAHQQAELNRQRQLAAQQVEAERLHREAAADARRKAQEAADRAAHQRLLDEGKRQLAKGNYPAAATTLQSAHQLQKTDETERLLKQAVQKQAASPPPKPAPPPPPITARPAPVKPAPTRPPAPGHANATPAPALAMNSKTTPPPKSSAFDGYTKQMQSAAAWEKQQRYAEAAAAYREALRLVPGDLRAGAGLHMAEGRRLLAAKRFPDAAREFEAVLKLIPNQPDAVQALKQARQGRP
jgi:tetratricopeptide (TPR) repeat protein